jgi:FemAB-related protein (PEP-CTERM system-associated)
VALRKVWQQYRTAKSNCKELRDQAKALSRRIGEAKREGIAVDALMTEMQETSAQLRLLTNESSRAEKELLAYFVTSEDCDNQAGPDKPSLLPGVRKYNDPFGALHEVSISQLDGDHADWNAYVDQNPDASIYHRAEWRELIRNTFGHTGFYYVAKDREQRIAGILPVVHLKSRLFGDFMVSMPYFNYGGAVADHPSIEQLLMQSANRQAACLGASHIEYRDNIPREAMPARTEKVNMILPLPDSPDSLMQSFDSKLRSQIRRPQRENPGIHFGGEEYLHDFYSVFSRNMRDLGTPVYSKDFFGNILHCFPGNCRIVVVRLMNKPVAAAFLIGFRDALEIPWASSLREVSHLSMNIFLYWEILKFAIENNYRSLDFGRSSRDTGTYRFKQQWGAIPRQSYWHYWLSTGNALPAINPGNPKYAIMISLWKRLPLSLSRLLGPPIVKNIP